MPDYAKLHELLSHRVNIEYDTGARITGYVASVQPSSGPVQFFVLSDAKMIDAAGKVVREAKELALSPNVPTSIGIDEGPRGRDLPAK
jgi:hypothetical protein